MSNKYITLASSNSSISKKFKAIQMAPVLERSDELQRTLGGTMDKSIGAITALHQYVLRVPADTAETGYGLYSDLKSLFMLNNPNGIPSDKITLTDHYGDTHVCVFVGNLAPEMLTTVLEGVNAHFMIKVALAEVAALDDNPSA